MKMMIFYVSFLAAALVAVSCSDDSSGGGNDGGDTGTQNDVVDSGSAESLDTSVQQTGSDDAPLDSQTPTTDNADTSADSATVADSVDTAGTAQDTVATDTTGTSDTADTSESTTGDTATELSAAMTVCLAGMATIGAKCGWDADDTDDVYANCLDLEPIGEDAMTALFLCAAQIECATWANDAAAEAATAACLETAGSNITVTEAAEAICDYSTACLRGDTAVLSEQMFYNGCMATWETGLAGQPSVVLDVFVGCVPDTTTCSDEEVASFEGCVGE